MHERRLEGSPDNAGDLQRGSRCFVQHVDAALHQSEQRVGYIEVPERGGVGRIDPMTVDVVDELLEVERISLRPLEHELDQLDSRVDRPAEQLLQLGPQHQSGIAGVQLGEAQLLEVWDPFETQPSARVVRRPIGQHEQHRQRCGREDQLFEQVPRESDRSNGSPPARSPARRWRRRAKQVDEQRLQRCLAQLGVERARQLVVVHADADTGAEQRAAAREVAGDRPQPTGQRRRPERFGCRRHRPRAMFATHRATRGSSSCDRSSAPRPTRRRHLWRRGRARLRRSVATCRDRPRPRRRRLDRRRRALRRALRRTLPSPRHGRPSAADI